MTETNLWTRPDDATDSKIAVPPDAPDDLHIRSEAPAPLTTKNSDLGVRPNEHVKDGSDRPHRLVTIGDSLTQGFQSLAISKTELSWPMIVARSFGFAFDYPRFDGPIGSPGLPVNMEGLARTIEDSLRERALPFEQAHAAEVAARTLIGIRHFWEDGDGSKPGPVREVPYDNLAIWGWDVRDALSKSRGWCQNVVDKHPSIRERFSVKDQFMTAHPNERTAIRTLATDGVTDFSLTQVSAAKALGEEGIDTLVVALGANNALGSVIGLELNWSGDGYDDIDRKGAYNVWRPEHFRAELDALVAQIQTIDSARTIWFTVPHVTVAPLLHGMGEKPYYSRYFPRYGHAWQGEASFDPNVDKCLTGDDARLIDAAIDQYNWAIKNAVHDAREDRGQDWYVMDLCGLLDRLAYRRYLASPSARPDWMSEADKVLPPELLALSPRPDTRSLSSDEHGRTQGGLIALDGVHPTTIGYGLIAREVAEIMLKSEVRPANEGADGRVDFTRLIGEDTLISNPLRLLGEEMRLAGTVNHLIDLVGTLRHE